MIDRIECPRASIIGYDHTRSQLRGRLLNIKSRLFARKNGRGSSAWLSRRLIKCKWADVCARARARAHFRRQIKLFRRYASRAQKSGRGRTRAAGRAKRGGRGRGRGRRQEEAARKKKEDQGWARTYNVSKRHLPLSSLLSSHRAVARKAARLELADLISRRDQRTTYIVNCSHFRSTAPRLASPLSSPRRRNHPVSNVCV